MIGFAMNVSSVADERAALDDQLFNTLSFDDVCHWNGLYSITGPHVLTTEAVSGNCRACRMVASFDKST